MPLKVKTGRQGTDDRQPAAAEFERHPPRLSQPLDVFLVSSPQFFTSLPKRWSSQKKVACCRSGKRYSSPQASKQHNLKERSHSQPERLALFLEVLGDISTCPATLNCPRLPGGLLGTKECNVQRPRFYSNGLHQCAAPPPPPFGRASSIPSIAVVLVRRL